MEASEGMYDDLEGDIQDAEQEELKCKLNKAQDDLAKEQALSSEIGNKLTQANKEKEELEKNILQLYKTATIEIERKDKEIQRLLKELTREKLGKR
jgi:predicted  nucleic acid-binding Zn-ribbon protein